LTRLEVSTTDAAWQAAATAAINEGQRLYSLLTLSQETTREFVLTPGVKFYRMLTEGWTHWLVPLRVRLSNDTATGNTNEFDTQDNDAAMFNEQAYSGLTSTTAPKLKPATAYQMAALSNTWISDTGTPSRYGCLGWDLLFLDRSPTQEGQKLLITYARSTVTLVLDADVPEIPEADHSALISYATFRLRCNEGGQELQAAMPMLTNFTDLCKMRADEVRARSKACGYDRLPPELTMPDVSRTPWISRR
jgi:hypothetical protein